MSKSMGNTCNGTSDYIVHLIYDYKYFVLIISYNIFIMQLAIKISQIN